MNGSRIPKRFQSRLCLLFGHDTFKTEVMNLYTLGKGMNDNYMSIWKIGFNRGNFRSLDSPWENKKLLFTFMINITLYVGNKLFKT